MLQEILLKVEVIEKRIITVSETETIISDDVWRIAYNSGITSEWKRINEKITLDSDIYEIEFKDIEGYNKPKNYICDLTEDQDLIINPIYTKKDYSYIDIVFKIDKQYINNLTWRLVQLEDKIIIDWNNNITDRKFINNGNYQLQIKEYKKDETSTYNNIYNYETGELLEIPEFYIKAENIDIVVMSDTIKTITYNSSNLYLTGSKACVTIQPEELEDIIKWKIKNNSTTSWFESGKTIYLPYGNYQIELTDCPGWNYTKLVNLNVNSSDKIFLVGVEGEENGNLRIKFESQNIKDNARWRIVGTNIWYMDNEEISLIPNSYKIEFSSISNYVTPDIRNLIVESGKLNIYTITYVLLGQIKIDIINLSDILEFGIPYWRIKDKTDWKQSGVTEKIVAGTYTIEFNTVNNIYTHDDIEVIVTNEHITMQDIIFDGLKIFAIPSKNGIKFLNYNNFDTLNIIPELSVSDSINQIKFNKESTLLAIAQNKQPYLNLYDFISFTKFNDLYFKSPLGGCRSIDFSNDKKYLVVSHNNYPYLTIYNTSDWSKIQLQTTPSNVCNSVKFSPNNTYLTVTFDKNPYMIVYETVNFSSISNIELNEEVLSCDYNSTENYLVLGCTNDIKIFDIDSGFNELIVDVSPKIIKGSVYSTHFFNNYLIIVTSLSFSVYYCIKEDNKYILNNILSEAITNVNNYSMITSDNNYFIIGCSNYPYMLVYKTSDWKRVEDFNYISNYCKKFDISGDMSIREFIYTPTNIFPTNSYKGFKDTEKLKGSDFKYRKLTDTDTHIKSQWRLLNEDLEIVYDSDESDDLIELSLPLEYFVNNKNYFWQVRYKSQNIGWSFWSHPTLFTVLETYVQKPVNINPIDSAEDVEEIPTFVSSVFTVVNTTDVHIKSQWRILDSSNLIVYESGAINDLISFTLPAGILIGSTDINTNKYYWQVQHKGQIEGWSEWSDKTSFTTAIWAIEQPVNISPADNDIDVSGLTLTLTSSEYKTTSVLDTHVNSRYEIYYIDINGQEKLIFSSGELTDIRVDTDLTFEVPADIVINNELTYKWHISYKGSVLGWSEWSDYTTFTSQPKGMSRISIVTLPPPEDTMFLPNRNNIPLRWRWCIKNDVTYSQYYLPEDSNKFGSNYVDIESGKEIVISFETYDGLISPAPITIDLLPNKIYRYIGVYGVSLGSLQVNITGTVLGRWRFVNTDVWRDSGYIESNLPFNVYEIEFYEVSGFFKPSNIKSTVNSVDLLTLETVTYSINPSSIYYLMVEIDGNSNGKWHLDSDPEDTWRNSGDKIDLTGIDLDDIQFKNIVGYITPDEIKIQIPEYYDMFEEMRHPNTTLHPRTFYFKRTYLEEVKYGFLIVNLTPAIGQWQIEGETSWRNSGVKCSIPIGTQTILFKNLAAYNPLSNETVTILVGETLTKDYSYVKIIKYGSIQVNLTPTSTFKIKDKQTDIYIKVNNNEIINTNTIVDNLIVGETYIVEYKKLSGYSILVSDTIKIENTDLITLDKKYKIEGDTGYVKGVLNIINGKWKVKDSVDWYDDNKLADFEVGVTLFEFKDVSGFITPLNQTLTILKDKTLILEGVYTQIKTISNCIELNIIPDILCSNNRIKYRTRYKENETSEFGNWSDWITYFKSLVNGVLRLNNRITNPKNGIHEIEFSSVSGYTLNESKKQITYNGKGLNVSFDYGGTTTAEYGTIGIVLNICDQNGKTIASEIEKILEIKHAIISDDIYNNKKFNEITWESNWTKYSDFDSIYNKLSAKVKHAFYIKSIDGYFNKSANGNIYLINYSKNLNAIIDASFIKFTRSELKLMFTTEGVLTSITIDPDKPSLSVISDKTTLTSTLGTFNISVSNISTGTMNWIAKSNSSWITIKSGLSGKNNGTVVCSYTANTSSTETRTGSITITATDTTNSPQTITLTQEKATISISFTPEEIKTYTSIHQMESTSATILKGRKGFKQYYNVNDSELMKTYLKDNMLQMIFTITEENIVAGFFQKISKSFRVCVPPGCIACSISVDVLNAEQDAYGKVSWNKIISDTAIDTDKDYPIQGWIISDIINANDTCIYKCGPSSSIYTERQIFVTNQNGFAVLEKGGWLVVKLASQTATAIRIGYRFNYDKFKIWYNSIEWDSNNDPK